MSRGVVIAAIAAVALLAVVLALVAWPRQGGQTATAATTTIQQTAATTQQASPTTAPTTATTATTATATATAPRLPLNSSFYEANYTMRIRVAGPVAQEASGWLLVGVGPANYTLMELAAGPVGKVSAAAAYVDGAYRVRSCVGSSCSTRTERAPVGVLEAFRYAEREVGTCRHGTYLGVLREGNGTVDVGALVPAAANLTVPIRARACVAEGVPLWMQVRANVTVGAFSVSVAVELEAASIGPYNATRYRRILDMLSGGPPLSYEANYTWTVRAFLAGRSAMNSTGWLAVGVGPAGYLLGVYRRGLQTTELAGAEVGGTFIHRACTSSVLGSLCIFDEGKPEGLPVGLAEEARRSLRAVGNCSHGGLSGVLWAGEAAVNMRELGLPLPQNLNATISAELCEAGDLPLYLRGNVTFREARDLRVLVELRLASLGPYNATRHRQLAELVGRPALPGFSPTAYEINYTVVQEFSLGGETERREGFGVLGMGPRGNYSLFSFSYPLPTTIMTATWDGLLHVARCQGLTSCNYRTHNDTAVDVLVRLVNPKARTAGPCRRLGIDGTLVVEEGEVHPTELEAIFDQPPPNGTRAWAVVNACRLGSAILSAKVHIHISAPAGNATIAMELKAVALGPYREYRYRQIADAIRQGRREGPA